MAEHARRGRVDVTKASGLQDGDPLHGGFDDVAILRLLAALGVSERRRLGGWAEGGFNGVHDGLGLIGHRRARWRS
jgi:hypothetical protein